MDEYCYSYIAKCLYIAYPYHNYYMYHCKFTVIELLMTG